VTGGRSRWREWTQSRILSLMADVVPLWSLILVSSIHDVSASWPSDILYVSQLSPELARFRKLKATQESALLHVDVDLQASKVGTLEVL